MDEDIARDLRTWLVEPDHSATQRRPLELDRRQRDLASSRTPSGFRRIKGAAGSGKSQVLAARAAQLASEGKDVLVVTFNITLMNYLRDLAVRYPSPRQRSTQGITWLNFHQWCKLACLQAGMEPEYRRLWKDENPDDVFNADLSNLVREAVREAPESITQYDAILVDEGQDFNLDWWDALRDVLRDGGEMVMVADETQDIYDRARNWTEDRMIGAGFSGDWARLSGSHRLPPALVPLLREFIDGFMGMRVVNLPDAAQIELDLTRLRWVQVERGRIMDETVKAVFDLPGFADPDLLAFSDISLLVDVNERGLECVQELEQRDVRVTHTFGKGRHAQNRKRAFYMGDSRMKATTVYSFKGWEARAIVLQVTRASSASDLRALYVGLTRLKRHDEGSYLTVVCSSPALEVFGRSFPTFERVGAE